MKRKDFEMMVTDFVLSCNFRYNIVYCSYCRPCIRRISGGSIMKVYKETLKACIMILILCAVGVVINLVTRWWY